MLASKLEKRTAYNFRVFFTVDIRKWIFYMENINLILGTLYLILFFINKILYINKIIIYISVKWKRNSKQ